MSYTSLNKWVCSIQLKSPSIVLFQMASGNSLHSLGPDIRNDLPRNVFLLLLRILSNLLTLYPVALSLDI